MRNTILNNAWNTTEWGLAFLRVSSFPLDPSVTFETMEEFLNYLEGNDVDKPYLGLLIAVKSDKYHIFLVLSYDNNVWEVEELNKSDLDNIHNIIEEFKEKVEEDLQDLKDELKGEVLPDYDTLKKLLDAIIKYKVLVELLVHNLQTELDQTQTGIGLSGDGAFNSDLETNYLRDATSVMNALKILDGKIHESAIKLNLTPSNLDIVPIEIYETSEGNIISASLSLSNTVGNLLSKKSDGLYNNVQLEYSEGTLVLKVNENIVSSYNLGVSTIVEDAYYDSSLESLVFIFKLLNGESLRIRVPVSSLIREWDVDNSGVSDVVELTRQESIGEGTDKLSADVRISTKQNNLLLKDGNTLYVSGLAESIIYNGLSVSLVLSDIKNNLNLTDEELNNIEARIRKEISDLQYNLQSTDSVLSDLLTEVIQKADIDSPILKGVPQIENIPDIEDSSNRIPSTSWVIKKINESYPINPGSYWLKLSE